MQVKFFNNWNKNTGAIDILTIGVHRSFGLTMPGWSRGYKYTFAFAVLNFGFYIRFWKQAGLQDIPF